MRNKGSKDKKPRRSRSDHKGFTLNIQSIEPLSAEKVNEALSQWRAENDSSADYPTFGEVMAQQYGSYNIDVAKAFELYGDHALNCKAHPENWSAVFTTEYLKGRAEKPGCTCGYDDVLRALK
jgi:hypothetical protein